MKGPLKKDGKPTRKLLALRKWKCRNYEMGGPIESLCKVDGLMQHD